MQNSIGFYSLATKLLEEFPKKRANPNELIRFLNHRGVSFDELLWSGILNDNNNLNELYFNKKTIDKLAWVPLLNQHLNNIHDYVDYNNNLYVKYMYAGYENYREIFIQYVNDKWNNYGCFFSKHYPSLKNIIVHLRLSDRFIDGKKIIHLDEIQSEWAAFIRKEGITKTLYDAEQSSDKINNLNIEKSLVSDKNEKLKINEKIFEEIAKIKTKIPEGPYVTKVQQWVDIGLCRAFFEAVKFNYDGFALTKGEEHKRRWVDSNNVIIKNIIDLPYFYNTIVYKRIIILLQKIDPSIKITSVKINEKDEIFYFKITDLFKEKVQKGLPIIICPNKVRLNDK